MYDPMVDVDAILDHLTWEVTIFELCLNVLQFYAGYLLFDLESNSLLQIYAQV